jgi:hypothetical protein
MGLKGWPQPNCHGPPTAHAPNPINVIIKSELPSFFVFIAVLTSIFDVSLRGD